MLYPGTACLLSPPPSPEATSQDTLTHAFSAYSKRTHCNFGSRWGSPSCLSFSKIANKTLACNYFTLPQLLDESVVCTYAGYNSPVHAFFKICPAIHCFLRTQIIGLTGSEAYNIRLSHPILVPVTRVPVVHFPVHANVECNHSQMENVIQSERGERFVSLWLGDPSGILEVAITYLCWLALPATPCYCTGWPNQEIFGGYAAAHWHRVQIRPPNACRVGDSMLCIKLISDIRKLPPIIYSSCLKLYLSA